jgi:hypothetical protein
MSAIRTSGETPKADIAGTASCIVASTARVVSLLPGKLYVVVISFAEEQPQLP